MRRQQPYFEIAMSKPCTEAWSEMQGSSRGRRCESCDKQVHNLAAMSAREIEKLIGDHSGKLCARVSRRPDGSLVTLDGRPKPGLAASLAFSGSLVLGGTASAQSAPPSTQETAVLTGTILVPNGSAPAVGASITLEAEGKTVSEVKADNGGNFRVSVAPGQYDIRIRQNALFGVRIRNADLHQGLQSLQPLPTRFGLRSEGDGGDGTPLVGEMVMTLRYPISYVFKHPWRYLKNLPHNF